MTQYGVGGLDLLPQRPMSYILRKCPLLFQVWPFHNTGEQSSRHLSREGHPWSEVRRHSHSRHHAFNGVDSRASLPVKSHLPRRQRDVDVPHVETSGSSIESPTSYFESVLADLRAQTQSESRILETTREDLSDSDTGLSDQMAYLNALSSFLCLETRIEEDGSVLCV